jgi:hypothetical protein
MNASHLMTDRTPTDRVGSLQESGHPKTGADACSAAAIGNVQPSARPFYVADMILGT